MECESLARAEAMSACNALGSRPAVIDSDPGVLIVDTTADPAELGARLALCHHISEWLGSDAHGKVDSLAHSIDVPGPIRVRSTKVGLAKEGVDLQGMSQHLGGIIGKGRGVDLHRPGSDIRVVFSDRAHIGRVLCSIDRSAFEKRKNNRMPFRYPVSLHPKFARSLVNLTQVPKGRRLLDPFCGTGAIVAEAAMLGLDAVGTDLSEKMIQGAQTNLSHLRVRARLSVSDVGDISSVVSEADGIATDPPYGRSTSTNGESIPQLYKRSFDSFAAVLRKGSRIATIFPDMGMVDDASDFRLVGHHSLWVHRSLTRNFCVLERI